MKVSNETYKKRIEAIYDICKKFAYEDNGYYFISLWELADNLNNSWYAKLFFTKKELLKKRISHHDYNGDIALEHFEIHNFINRLKTTIKKIKGASLIVIPSKYNVWAKIPINTTNKQKV